MKIPIMAIAFTIFLVVVTTIFVCAVIQHGSEEEFYTQDNGTIIKLKSIICVSKVFSGEKNIMPGYIFEKEFPFYFVILTTGNGSIYNSYETAKEAVEERQKLIKLIY